ncbi:LuxR family two component transcriptional regulator [Paraburkholderia sp. BL10I2N1]|nr:LuxR family two component transcriptional regulator [Paraburkholderia sp. BL10I2N1]
MTKVLIADDHTLVRDGLRHILQNASGFEVIGEANDGTSTIALIRDMEAHVLVLDLSMPGRNGVELIKQIKDEKPALRILVLTMHAEQQYAVRAFKAGASGYLTKESASAELVSAVTKVVSGGIYVSLAMAEQFAQSLNEPVDTLPHQRLSDREFDDFRRIAAGQTISEIAQEPCVSAKTVSTYKTRILEKMQMPHEAALVRYALRHSFLVTRTRSDRGAVLLPFSATRRSGTHPPDSTEVMARFLRFMLHAGQPSFVKAPCRTSEIPYFTSADPTRFSVNANFA